MSFQWSAIIDALPALFDGTVLTIKIAIIGLIGGFILGGLFGVMRAYGNKFINYIGFLYIEFVRGTPIVVQVMFIYFVLPFIANIRMDPIIAAYISIAINSGAYIAEIVRGTLLSVNKGLKEAGLALGLPSWKVLIFVIGPVAFRRIIPPLGNQCIVSLKDTSLFIVIGVGELTRQGQEIVAENFKTVEIWTTIAVFYLVMTGVLSFALRVVEKRMKIL